MTKHVSKQATKVYSTFWRCREDTCLIVAFLAVAIVRRLFQPPL